MFVTHGSEIWTKSLGPNYTKFWAFWQKENRVFENYFWQSVGAILENIYVPETIV